MIPPVSRKFNYIYVSLAVLSSIFNASCVNFKNIPYFKNLPDSVSMSSVDKMEFKNPIIQPDDIVNINIQALDPTVNQLINNFNVSVPSTGGSAVSNLAQPQTISGYLVDKNGEVNMPFLGKIKLEGLTTLQAKENIQESISKYITDPVVSVRFANYKITVLGEVARPSSYILPNEKVTILDAISLAGDLTIFGKRENILLIRERNNQHVSVRLNLNSKDILKSPYFYLQPNDVVYVEPNRAKIANSDGRQLRYTGVLVSTLSIILVFLARTLK